MLPDVDELEVFVAIAQSGNLTRAARQLGLPKSTVSRRLAALEARLDVRLVTRSTQGVAITAAGGRLLARIAPALEALREALRETADDERAIRGRLRVSVPTELGLFHGGRVLREFVTAHPDITLDVVHTDRQVDLVAEGFDAAIRIGSLRDTSVVARVLGDVPGCLIASPAYLRAHGAPATPRDLAKHTCVVFGGPGAWSRWRLTGPKAEIVEIDVSGRYAANSLGALCDAAAEGLGIARVPTYVAAGALAAGRVVPVLEAWRPANRTAYVVYPATGKLPARVRALIEWLLAHAPTAPRAGSARRRG
jgi:DNA-binding transcriptional LysR family regulator